MDLDDTGGFHSRPQDVLLGRLVLLVAQSVEVVQEAVKEEDKEQAFSIEVITCNFKVTYYLAESFSWYSFDLEKHSWTPLSTQSLFMPANSSSEKGSVSSILDTTSMTILASPCNKIFRSCSRGREAALLNTNLSVLVGERDPEVWHRAQDGHQRLDGVTVDNGSVLLEVFHRKTALVNDPTRRT